MVDVEKKQRDGYFGIPIEIWNGLRFLWQAGTILAALYLLVRFVKWAWFH